MGQKLFSVITPALNAGPKIEKTVNSVLSQNKDLFEFIVLDGGSTDGSLELVERYGDEITVVTGRDEGVYDAMNKGVELASGKYLYFLGAGDSLRTNILARIEGLMPRDELAFVYGNVYMIDRGVIYDGEFDRAKLRKRNICHQAVFYGRGIFDAVGRYEPRFHVLADHALNLKCFFNHRIQKTYLAYVIANFEGGGISFNERDEKFAREYGELMSLAGEESASPPDGV